jgi:osmotically-inducible protein OsmY
MNTKVETRYGVVTLSGKAGNDAEMNLTSKLAKELNSVKDVNNLMAI